MCLCFVKKGNPVLRNKVVSVVVVCQKKSRHRKERHLHLLRGQRRSDREREERGEGFGDHETSESRASRGSQQTGEHDRDG